MLSHNQCPKQHPLLQSGPGILNSQAVAALPFPIHIVPLPLSCIGSISLQPLAWQPHLSFYSAAASALSLFKPSAWQLHFSFQCSANRYLHPPSLPLAKQDHSILLTGIRTRPLYFRQNRITASSCKPAHPALWPFHLISQAMPSHHALHLISETMPSHDALHQK